MDNQELQKILQKRLPLGILWGYELLLTPNSAINFIDDLAQIGVKVTGCDLWHFIKPDKDPHWIVDITGAGIIVDDSDIPQEHSAERYAKIVKNYITHDLPKEADLISLLYDDDHVHIIYDFFRTLAL